MSGKPSAGGGYQGEITSLVLGLWSNVKTIIQIIDITRLFQFGQGDRFGIPITDLTQPHFSCCLMQGPKFSQSSLISLFGSLWLIRGVVCVAVILHYGFNVLFSKLSPVQTIM